MKPDEMAILKSASIRIAPDVLLVMSYQYHSEKESGSVKHSKSAYRWVAEVKRLPELEAEIQDLQSDARRLEAWRLPNDTWPGKISSFSGSSNCSAAAWYAQRVKKAVSWEKGLDFLQGTDSAKSRPAKLIPAAGTFVSPSGEQVDITEPAEVLKFVGQVLVRQIPMPRNDAAKRRDISS